MTIKVKYSFKFWALLVFSYFLPPAILILEFSSEKLVFRRLISIYAAVSIFIFALFMLLQMVKSLSFTQGIIVKGYFFKEYTIPVEDLMSISKYGLFAKGRKIFLVSFMKDRRAIYENVLRLKELKKRVWRF